MIDLPSVPAAALSVIRQLSAAEIAYAISPDRGEYRGFAALHDLMDANMLLPGAAEDYDAFTDDAEGRYVAYCNLVMAEVNRLLISGVLA